MSSVAIMNISLAILVEFDSRGLRKENYIYFSNSTFPIGMVIINIANYV